ncbi:sensor domain-containing diguanylate cyclase [Bacillus sp. BRMEA1]|uniref:sensor domain-containing diguanylate cyclase n=1 Tax=Neobacillus endophyticus TaxID=2738405 RepID=UPI0015648A5A|nr:sensor domain-containing diguanylate cyclase [Neobacillus endophyticus]NRD79114.1 sensor domain-containing diguanylate cyclase [Neobacillus endophyticus]
MGVLEKIINTFKRKLTKHIKWLINFKRVSKKHVENLTWLNEHYKILNNFAQICSKTLDEDILLKRTYEMVSEVMPTDCFYLASYTEGEDYFTILLLVDKGEYIPSVTVEIGENNTSRAIKSREIIHHRRKSDDTSVRYYIGTDETKSHIFVPIIIDDQVKGVISAQCLREFAYRKEHEELLQIIGTQVLTSIETARLYEKIYTMSYTDNLTGVFNRGYFEKQLEKYAMEVNTSVAIVICDLDELKYVNDHYGHKAGDLLINTTASILNDFSSDSVITARLGGDEFALLITNSTLSEVEKLVQSINEKVNSYRIESIMHTIKMSMGFAYKKDSINNMDRLFTEADTNMYQNKKKRKLVSI